MFCTELVDKNKWATVAIFESEFFILQDPTVHCIQFTINQTCSQVSEVQVQVKSQVFEVKSKSSLKSLKRSPSQVLSL